MGWFVYIVRCGDGSLYCGVTTNLQRRIGEHNGKGKGAKYTRNRQPVELVYSKRAKNRSSAQKKEAQLRKLSREEKLLLLN